MKNIIFSIALILLISLSGISQALPHVNALTVYAPSGLTLRESPNQHGKILDVIEFGERVIAFADDDIPAREDRLGWVNGQWKKIEYQGIQGYVFDGYLSGLPFPTFEFELCDSDFDFINSLDSWARYRLEPDGEEDTIAQETGVFKTIQSFEGNQRLVVSEYPDRLNLDLYLSGIRIMDAYHLLMSMIPGKHNREIFTSESIFIDDKLGDIKAIKINLGYPIHIKKWHNGQIRLSTYKSEFGCSF